MRWSRRASDRGRRRLGLRHWVRRPDHVLASGYNVNVLVLDTRFTPTHRRSDVQATTARAVAKFAAGGSPGAKKDLGMIAMTYGNIYVARVAFG